MIEKHIPIFDALDKLNAFQFASYISGSQYLKAYGLAQKYIPAQAKVLDWGAGNGHFSYFLLNKGFNVTAFTIYEGEDQLSGHLKIKFPNNYNRVVSPESTALPFEDNSFDAVVSIGVLEHVRESGGNELGSLNEIKRVLKPNGVFICYHFPNKFSWIEAVNKHRKSKHHHIYKFTKKDIKDIARSAGMKLLEVKRYGVLPRLSLRSFPNNIGTTKLYNIADNVLSAVFNIFSQNNYFVAKK